MLRGEKQIGTAVLRKLARIRKVHNDRIIRISDNGFEVIDSNDGERLVELGWKEVRRIETYKIDLFVVDCVCLLFRLSGNKKPVELLEEWHGFKQLAGAMENEFPGIPKDWFASVALPPFETNRTVLFECSTLS